jgi:very-short-patch-repair endonuclease
VKFQRQAAIGKYIVDCVCFSHRLIVEFDGPQHVEDGSKEYDARRTNWLELRRFRVIPFRNQELDEDIWRVVDEIHKTLCKREEDPLPSPPRKGEGAERD